MLEGHLLSSAVICSRQQPLEATTHILRAVTGVEYRPRQQSQAGVQASALYQAHEINHQQTVAQFVAVLLCACVCVCVCVCARARPPALCA